MTFEHILLKNGVKLKGKIASIRFHQKLRTLSETQNALLMDIVQSQSETEFGKKYGFSSIKNVADFRRQVPIFDYEALRPYILKQDETQKPHINAQPHLFYAVTSGTTGTPKYIPVTPQALADQKQVQMLFQYHLLRDCPGLLNGKILSIVSPAIEGHLPSGTPFGSTSGQIYGSLPKAIQNRYVVPFPILEIEDYDLKYLTILRLALNEPHISYFTSANPSTFVRLKDLLIKYWDVLLNDLSTGTFFRVSDLNETQRQVVKQRLVPQPGRAQTLGGFKTFRGQIRFCDIWPSIDALAVWTGGNSGIFLEALKREFSPHTVLRDLGYLSSEFRGTVPLLNHTNSGAPTFLHHFFEFVEKDSWNDGVYDFKGLHELQKGKQYAIFVTTRYGLYRYNMNDIVEVTGFYPRSYLPLLKFVQKGKGVTSLTGEKLYEGQVLQAVAAAETTCQSSSAFFMLCAQELPCRYVLFYEPATQTSSPWQSWFLPLQQAVNTQLETLNLEYQAKQKSGRLGQLELKVLKPGAFDAYKRHKLAQGQREAQFKM